MVVDFGIRIPGKEDWTFKLEIIAMIIGRLPFCVVTCYTITSMI